MCIKDFDKYENCKFRTKKWRICVLYIIYEVFNMKLNYKQMFSNKDVGRAEEIFYEIGK